MFLQPEIYHLGLSLVYGSTVDLLQSDRTGRMDNSLSAPAIRQMFLDFFTEKVGLFSQKVGQVKMVDGKGWAQTLHGYLWNKIRIKVAFSFALDEF